MLVCHEKRQLVTDPSRRENTIASEKADRQDQHDVPKEKEVIGEPK